jgi:hypothetical protein
MQSSGLSIEAKKPLHGIAVHECTGLRHQDGHLPPVEAANEEAAVEQKLAKIFSLQFERRRSVKKCRFPSS